MQKHLVRDGKTWRAKGGEGESREENISLLQSSIFPSPLLPFSTPRRFFVLGWEGEEEEKDTQP